MEKKDKKTKVTKVTEKIADKILDDFGDFCKTQVCRYHRDGLSYGCDLYFTAPEASKEEDRQNPCSKNDYIDRKNPELYRWEYSQDNMGRLGVTYIGRIKGEGLMYNYPDEKTIAKDFKGYTEEDIDNHFTDWLLDGFRDSDDLRELRQTLIYFIETGEIE